MSAKGKLGGCGVFDVVSDGAVSMCPGLSALISQCQYLT